MVASIGITPACAGKRFSRPRAPRGWRDHPRVCGEKRNIPRFAAFSVGSPPRVRGKAAPRAVIRQQIGITPACAGKSRARLYDLALVQDHPRVCGEKTSARMASSWSVGSPPRVRGKEQRLNKLYYTSGITPACAGKRRLTAFAARPRGDHPRVCGEKSGLCRTAEKIPGSPPRVRGKVSAAFFPFGTRGITPACAGKSAIRCTFSPMDWDHPRVCGEKFRNLLLKGKKKGSPPRVRGKVVIVRQKRIQIGITPACAGKSIIARYVRFRSQDHPRVCGEELCFVVLILSHMGSPPRVRGKAITYVIICQEKGITPACAGKRATAAALRRRRRDHPRVCGEK